MAIKIISADTWFSKCIREGQNWQCERCEAQHKANSMGLHCAHFMTRGNWSTRFDPDNAASLCYGCHSYLDSHPYEKTAWFEAKLGEGLAQIVREKAKQPAYGIKKYKAEIAKHYRDQYRAMLARRAAGECGKLTVVGWA